MHGNNMWLPNPYTYHALSLNDMGLAPGGAPSTFWAPVYMMSISAIISKTYYVVIMLANRDTCNYNL